MPHSNRLRRPLTALIMVMGGSLLLVACSPTTNTTTPVGSGGTAAATTAATPAPPPSVSVVPADGAKGVSLDTAVKVSADSGSIDSVVVHPSGDSVSFLTGALGDSSRSWTSTAPLSPGTDYVVEVTAHSQGGAQTTARTGFATTTPKRLTTSSQPQDGDTVGVAMPISLHFNAPVASDRQANLVSHLKVTTSPPVQGAWHWFAPDEVHFRPSDFWTTGTKVTLEADLLGVNAGNDVYGLGNWTMTFTIGAKHVSTIDAAAHQMVVTENDKTLYTWPVSTGRPKNPTLEGTLFVQYKQQDVLMDSQSIGIPRNSPDGYYEHVFWDTAVSTDGFFIHSAPWSEWAQGSTNVSHGCVNLSPDRAQTFFNFSQKGDLVYIKNTGRPADASDGEADWNIPFDQFANSGGASTPAASPGQPGGL
ncbi:MAG TPA: Ig-like domain-containing protein [Candidatus Angelobacter sp.]|jgi:lipoprotein-anchoring transpeptidase ErfK/SrfK|nr:Ig-like domain-containing protein [Candidatus Angelobacter sp.]